MLKFFFWSLLLANGALFAFHQGYLEELLPSGREPARLTAQLNADKIKLSPKNTVTPPGPQPAQPAATDLVPQVALAENSNQGNTGLACTEIGNFSNAEVRRFEAQLAALSLPVKQSRRDIVETSSHMVLIPSQKEKEAADKKASELRALGIADYFIMQDNPNPDLRWGISLGVFKSEEAAREHLIALGQKGVRSARLIEYKMPLRKVVVQLQGAGPQLKAAMEKLQAGLTKYEIRSCS